MSDSQYPSYGGGNDPYSNQGGQGGPPGSYPGGPGGPGGMPAEKPSNNLVWAILSTLFCCLPVGIVSIVFAAKVDGLWASGQYDAAREASDKAKKWALISAAIGVAFTVLYILFVVVVGVGSLDSVDTTP